MLVLIAMLLTVLSGCRRSNVDPQLPAETQAGKNTFGCKLNGRVWLPRSSLSLAIPAGVDLSYDPTFDGGTLSLQAKYWYRDAIDQNISTTEYIGIGLSQVSKLGQYSFKLSDQQAACSYSIYTEQERDKNTLRLCEYDNHVDQTIGMLTITKLDIPNQIVAGRFEFTLTKAATQIGCDSVIRITDGRFDMKF